MDFIWSFKKKRKIMKSHSRICIVLHSFESLINKFQEAYWCIICITIEFSIFDLRKCLYPGETVTIVGDHDVTLLRYFDCTRSGPRSAFDNNVVYQFEIMEYVSLVWCCYLLRICLSCYIMSLHDWRSILYMTAVIQIVALLVFSCICRFLTLLLIDWVPMDPRYD